MCAVTQKTNGHLDNVFLLLDGRDVAADLILQTSLRSLYDPSVCVNVKLLKLATVG